MAAGVCAPQAPRVEQVTAVAGEAGVVALQTATGGVERISRPADARPRRSGCGSDAAARWRCGRRAVPRRRGARPRRAGSRRRGRRLAPHGRCPAADAVPGQSAGARRGWPTRCAGGQRPVVLLFRTGPPGEGEPDAARAVRANSTTPDVNRPSRCSGRTSPKRPAPRAAACVRGSRRPAGSATRSAWTRRRRDRPRAARSKRERHLRLLPRRPVPDDHVARPQDVASAGAASLLLDLTAGDPRRPRTGRRMGIARRQVRQHRLPCRRGADLRAVAPAPVQRARLHSEPSARLTSTQRSSPSPSTRSCHGLQHTSQSWTSVAARVALDVDLDLLAAVRARDQELGVGHGSRAGTRGPGTGDRGAGHARIGAVTRTAPIRRSASQDALRRRRFETRVHGRRTAAAVWQCRWDGGTSVTGCHKVARRCAGARADRVTSMRSCRAQRPAPGPCCRGLPRAGAGGRAAEAHPGGDRAAGRARRRPAPAPRCAPRCRWFAARGLPRPVERAARPLPHRH